MQIFQTWVEMLPAIVGDARAPLSLAWKKLRRELSQAKSRWGRIKGPMGAVVANLLDLGWEAPEPWLWVDPVDGEAFDLLEGDADRLVELALG
eukprot:6969386-Pyramimonas_sp.AAC.1